MSMISEQVKELRELADGYKLADKPLAASTMYQAADTIESLSAKLQAANNMIEEMAEEIGNCYGRDTELTERARKYLAHIDRATQTGVPRQNEREEFMKNRKNKTKRVVNCREFTIDVSDSGKFTINIQDCRNFTINISDCRDYSINRQDNMGNKIKNLLNNCLGVR